MNTFWHGIELAPLLSTPWAWIVLSSALALALVMVALRIGSIWRVVAVCAIALLILNPVRVTQTRKAEPNIALVVVDDSPSQLLGNRKAQTDEALKALETKAAAIPNLKLHVVRLSDTVRPPVKETTLWSVMAQQLTSIPAHRLAGVLLLTEGQVHDIPSSESDAERDAIRQTLHQRPLHVLLSGSPDEYDRWLELGDTPRFGTVDSNLPLQVTAHSNRSGDGPFTLTVHHTDGTRESFPIAAGESRAIPFTLKHTGDNMVLLELSGSEEELSTANNRQVVRIHGTRNALRVLLITGKVYPGQRVWRNFLKADPSIDLVHFNILRNVQDEDGVPVSEMSLIPFPVDELFGEKIERFDLIVIDQFTGGGLIPRPYLNSIAQFVNNGGALLFVPDPEKAFAGDLMGSDVRGLLPLNWEKEPREQTFTPALSEAGRKHPVTAALGLENPKRKAGNWYRFLQAGQPEDTAFSLLQTPGAEPLLVLNKHGKGRVALLLTDQLWLWARGHDGGGPFQMLVRNMIHWLLGEPDLEDTALSARIDNRTLHIHYRSVRGSVVTLTVRSPSGAERQVMVTLNQNGEGSETVPAEEAGIYTVSDSDGRQAYAIAGEATSREWQRITQDATTLQPVADLARGGVYPLTQDTPNLGMIDAGADAAGNHWTGLVDNRAFSVTGTERTPLAPLWVYFLLGIAAAVMAWRNEAERPVRARRKP